MTAIDFEKYDKQIDLDQLKKDVREATADGGQYRDVPHGTYEVAVDKMELTESKKGDPMVSIWFKIVTGDYKNSRLFYNQVITQGFQIHLVNELLESMESGLDVKFESYKQYSQLLLDIQEEIDGTLEYAIEYGESRGYNTFKITDVFE